MKPRELYHAIRLSDITGNPIQCRTQASTEWRVWDDDFEEYDWGEIEFRLKPSPSQEYYESLDQSSVQGQKLLCNHRITREQVEEIWDAAMEAKE